MTPEPPAGHHELRVAAIVGDLGAGMLAQLDELTEALTERMIDEIEPLRGDPLLRQLLTASVGGNLEMFARIAQHGLEVRREAATPPAASEYARRLAQRGTDATALLRAYRLGQESALLWCREQLSALDLTRDLEGAAVEHLIRISFGYIDAVSAQVVADYEEERARWLAHSSSVRSAAMTQLLSGPVPDVDAAETALGYRLRQRHLAVVLWLDRDGLTDELRDLERLLTVIGRGVGARGAGLFVAQDRSTGWGWLPVGEGQIPGDGPDQATVEALERAGARVALGGVAAGADGFVSSHEQAVRVYELLSAGGAELPRFATWSDPDVRAATLLMHDLASTRRLVDAALGALARPDEGTATLRRTVRTFLALRDSYAASAEVLNVHKNTVRYRLDKAAGLRGRPLAEDRLDLELALIACEWLSHRLGAEHVP